ncbi:2-keto-4-pentenoate hydratase [Taklimakanibacter deserti]|uniref:2-keto-4-pentenoate hydratase n=1 Tax=Taklimakanibacter deserti TaxID=2267839 RepID=UPI000E653732
MDLAQAKKASELLLRHWQDGTTLDSLPLPLRPETRAQAYLIQSQMERLSPRPLAGWKIAATSLAGQRHIAVDGPLAGRLLAEMVYPDGATVIFGANHMRVAEAEFAFRMSRDLPPRGEPYTQDDVLAAVAALHLAIEIPDSRYTDFTLVGAAQLIADNACGHQFVLGPEAPGSWRGLDLAAHLVTGRVGERLLREGVGGNVLGDPRIALTWLANELSQHGMTLAKGQIVTTGTCLVPLEITAGDKVSVDYGALGEMTMQLA